MSIKARLFAVAMALAIPTIVAAQCHTVCAQQQVVVQQVAQNVVAQPVPVPIANINVPTYQYYGTPQAAPQQSVLSEADLDRIAEKVFQKIAVRLNLSPTPQSPQGPPSAPNKQSNSVVRPSLPMKTVSFDVGRLTTVMTQNCANCHAGNAESGGGHIFFSATRQLLDLDRETKLMIWEQTYSGDMPKNHAPLNDADTEILHLWARQR